MLHAALQLVHLLEALSLELGGEVLATDATGAVHHHGRRLLRFRIRWEPIRSRVKLGKLVQRGPLGTLKVAHVPLVPVAHVEDCGLGRADAVALGDHRRPALGLHVFAARVKVHCLTWHERLMLDAQLGKGGLGDRVFLE